MISEDGIRDGMERILTFYEVQKDKPFSEKIEAVETLREALGMSDTITAELAEWCEKLNGPGYDGALMMGVLIGLFAHEHDSLS